MREINSDSDSDGITTHKNSSVYGENGRWEGNVPNYFNFLIAKRPV